MQNTPTNIRPVTYFTLAYLVAGTWWALITETPEFVFYGVVTLVLAGVVLIVHRRAPLSAGLLWSLSIWGLLHMLGGLVPLPAGWPYSGTKPVFYSWWLLPGMLKYDHVIHVYGFGIATWLCWSTVRPLLQNPDRPSVGILALCTLGGMGLGAVNEVVEFVGTLLIPNNNVGGYLNTSLDMVANTVGTTGAAAMIYWKERRR